MKLIIGLGNPGAKYENTRHNVGHLVIKKLLSLNRLTLQSFPKLSAELAQIGQGSQDKVFLGISTDYMNNSGLAVQKITAYFKIDPSDIYIIHDDLDLPVGEWKSQFDRGPAGHNGIKSIIDQLGTQAFNRYRIGIDHPRNSANPNLPVEDYVLLPFNSEDKETVGRVIDEVCQTIQSRFI
ncbi:MAG TPA: aminoacyl-tRNA hydrolase [Patescibacteria group bacterium]